MIVLIFETDECPSVCLFVCLSVHLSVWLYVRTWILAVDSITFEGVSGSNQNLVDVFYVWNVGLVLKSKVKLWLDCDCDFDKNFAERHQSWWVSLVYKAYFCFLLHPKSLSQGCSGKKMIFGPGKPVKLREFWVLDIVFTLFYKSFSQILQIDNYFKPVHQHSFKDTTEVYNTDWFYWIFIPRLLLTLWKSL